MARIEETVTTNPFGELVRKCVIETDPGERLRLGYSSGGELEELEIESLPGFRVEEDTRARKGQTPRFHLFEFPLAALEEVRQGKLPSSLTLLNANGEVLLHLINIATLLLESADAERVLVGEEGSRD